MSDTVPGVEGERNAGKGLEADLDGNRKTCKEGDKGSGVDKADGVRAGHQEEAGGQSNTGDSVEGRQDRGQLLLVDFQMWGHWSVLSLCDQDGLLLDRSGLHGDDASHVETWSDDTASGGVGHGGPSESGDSVGGEHSVYDVCCI